MREALGDDRRALALEPCDLRSQGGPGGALADPVGEHASSARKLPARTVATSSIEQRLNRAFSIAQLLLVVGHTRLLSGRPQFYQRVCVR
ncbi:MAG: hypothetical protein ABSG93_03060 [Solirubrobacteraceae bacterium]